MFVSAFGRYISLAETSTVAEVAIVSIVAGVSVAVIRYSHLPAASTEIE